MDSEEKIVVNFVFSRKRAQWKHLKAIERMKNSGEISPELLQMVLVRFLVDENNQWVQPVKAVEILDELDGEQMQDAMKSFFDAVLETAVPKESGNSLNSPSEATPPSEFPIGSES